MTTNAISPLARANDIIRDLRAARERDAEQYHSAVNYAVRLEGRVKELEALAEKRTENDGTLAYLTDKLDELASLYTDEWFRGDIPNAFVRAIDNVVAAWKEMERGN